MLNNMPRLRTNSSLGPQSFIADEPQDNGMLAEELFVRMLRMERKRTERSHRRFVLMILEGGDLLKAADQEETLDKVLRALSQATRDTDIKGWYRHGHAIGVIFTEIAAAEEKPVVRSLSGKVTDALYDTLSVGQSTRSSSLSTSSPRIGTTTVRTGRPTRPCTWTWRGARRKNRPLPC